MILVNCSCCDVEYSRTRKQVNVVIKRSGKWTCRKCCAVAHGIAQSLPIGSDRVHKQSGYIEVKTADGWRRQHMVVMEARIGRRLLRSENVHHIDGDKTNNQIENLQLLTSAEHTAIHNRGSKQSEETKQKIAQAVFDTGRSKLNFEIAKQMREDFKKSGLSKKAYAEQMGIHQTAIGRVINNAAWRN